MYNNSGDMNSSLAEKYQKSRQIVARNVCFANKCSNEV